MQAQLTAQNARGPRALSWVDESYSNRKNLCVTNATAIDPTDDIQLKNIFGYVREKEDQAGNFAASNGAAILTCHSACPGTDQLKPNGGLRYTRDTVHSEQNTYLSPTSAKFDAQTPPAVGNPCDPTQTTTIGLYSANRFNSVPEWQYALTLTLTYTLPLDESLGKITFGGRLFHQSSLALTDTSALNPESIEPGKTTLDLNVDWKNVGGQPVDLGFFVTNVTDKLYRIGTNNLMQRSSVGVLANIYAPPRMWGFSLKYRFGSDAQ